MTEKPFSVWNRRKAIYADSAVMYAEEKAKQLKIDEEAVLNGTPLGPERHLFRMLEVLGETIADNMLAMRAQVDKTTDRVERMERLMELQALHQRKVPTPRVRAKHIEFCRAKRRLCPSCLVRALFDEQDNWIGEVDHHERASSAIVEHTWGVCKPCNLGFEVGKPQRSWPAIQEYHREMGIWLATQPGEVIPMFPDNEDK